MLAIATSLVACQRDAQVPTGASALGAAAVQEDLFTLVPATGLPGAQEARLSSIRGRPTSAEVHVGRLTATPGRVLQRGRAVRISLSQTVHVVAVGERVSQEEPQVISWAGSTRDGSGWVELVVTGSGATGTVWVGQTLYRFEPIGGGLHALIRVDLEKLPPEHTPDNPTGASTHAPAPAAGAPRASGGGPLSSMTASSSTRIDLLVVYTAAAASATNIGNLVSLAVNETNTSYSNSGISASVRSVYSAQVSYSEAGRSFLQHVQALEGTTDGMMDVVHTWRDQYGADVVVLIVNDSEACGRASQILATASTAFAAVHFDCATGNYSFGHEIGHLQGARHEVASDSSSTPFQYGHGYVDPSCQSRTIMATVFACAQRRVQCWSTPDVTCPVTGQVLGTATLENNARVLNETKGTLAGFRTPPPSVYISGKQYILKHESAQYTANTSDGTPPYTYEWRSRDGWGWSFGAWSPWYSTGGQNYTYASVNACGIDRKELQVRVTDAAAKTATASYMIYITNPC